MEWAADAVKRDGKNRGGARIKKQGGSWLKNTEGGGRGTRGKRGGRKSSVGRPMEKSGARKQGEAKAEHV